MVLTRTLMVLAAVGLAGCSLFETPCGRVAGSICTIPGESASCAFLKDVKSENHLAQRTCRDLESTAKDYAADPTSLIQKAHWMAAGFALRAIGFVGDQVAPAPTPNDQLKDAAHKAGAAAAEAGDAISNIAKNAGKIVQDTARDIKSEGK